MTPIAAAAYILVGVAIGFVLGVVAAVFSNAGVAELAKRWTWRARLNEMTEAINDFNRIMKEKRQ